MPVPQTHTLFEEALHINVKDLQNATIYKQVNDGYGNVYEPNTKFTIKDQEVIIHCLGSLVKTICTQVLYGVHPYEYVNDILALAGKQFIITNEISYPASILFKLVPGMIVKQLADYEDEYEIIQRDANGNSKKFICKVPAQFSSDLSITPVASFMKFLVKSNRKQRSNLRYMVTNQGILDIHQKPILPGTIISKFDDEKARLTWFTKPLNGPGYITNTKLSFFSPDKFANFQPNFDDYMKTIQEKDLGGFLHTADGSHITGFNDGSSIYDNDQWGSEDSDITSSTSPNDDNELPKKNYEHSEKQPVKDTTPLKKVYCPYNADLVVYDIHNRRVHDLCGTLTPEKFYDLILRINDDTKFDGFENFKCAVCELGVIAQSKHPEMDNDFDALHIMTETALDQQKQNVNGAFSYLNGFVTPSSPPEFSIPDIDKFNKGGTTNNTGIFSGLSNPVVDLNNLPYPSSNSLAIPSQKPTDPPMEMTSFEKAIKSVADFARRKK